VDSFSGDGVLYNTLVEVSLRWQCPVPELKAINNSTATTAAAAAWADISKLSMTQIE